MNRRSVLKSLGATTIAGSAVLGSGALTQVTAQRNVDINVTSDSNSAVELKAGTAAVGGFATINENSDQLTFSTANINQNSELVIGQTNDPNSADPTSNYITDAAFTVSDQANLSGSEVMGVDVSVTADSGDSNLGLLFLPTTSGDTDDLQDQNATGGLGYTSSDTVAHHGLTDGTSADYPELPNRYDTADDPARFLLDTTGTVGAEMLIQTDSNDPDGDTSTNDASFTIEVTAETITL